MIEAVTLSSHLSSVVTSMLAASIYHIRFMLIRHPFLSRKDYYWPIFELPSFNRMTSVNLTKLTEKRN